MPSSEKRKVIDKKYDKRYKLKLYEVTKTKYKVKDPDGHHLDSYTYWEVSGEYFADNTQSWAKFKKTFDKEIDAKIWFNNL